jgi:parallel beta-helix repeat protein
LNGVGQVVRNNEIHSGPHMAIRFEGNEHLIELNHIHDVVRDADDMAAIYAGRSWVSRGTVIRHNLLRNISGYQGGTHLPSAIYLDDGISGTVVEGNIILDVALGMMFNGGRENNVRHNLFIDNRRAMRYTSMETAYQTWAAMSWRTLWDELLAAPVDSSVWRAAYPQLSSLADDRPDLPKYSFIKENLIHNSPWVKGVQGIDAAVEELGEVSGNQEIDLRPGHFDNETGRFAFDAASGVFELLPGLEAIPVDRIGRPAKNNQVQLAY